MQSPPYIDPQTGKTYDTSNPTTKGWLTKQSVWLKVKLKRIYLNYIILIIFNKYSLYPINSIYVY